MTYLFSIDVLCSHIGTYRPGDLLRNPSSKFYALCKATGQEEFATLKKLAGA